MLIKNLIHNTFSASPFIPPTESASSLNKISGLLPSILFFSSDHNHCQEYCFTHLTSKFYLVFTICKGQLPLLIFEVLYKPLYIYFGGFPSKHFSHTYILFVFLFTPLRLSFPSRKSLVCSLFYSCHLAPWLKYRCSKTYFYIKQIELQVMKD